MSRTVESDGKLSVGRIRCFPVAHVKEYPFDSERKGFVRVLQGQERVIRHYLSDWAFDNPQYAALRDILIGEFGYSYADCRELSFDDVLEILTRRREPAGGTKADQRDTMGKEARVLAVLYEHPDWTNKRIAEAARVHEKSLYRMQNFRKAREILKTGRANIPRGSKDAETGRVEAWENQ